MGRLLLPVPLLGKERSERQELLLLVPCVRGGIGQLDVPARPLALGVGSGPGSAAGRVVLSGLSLALYSLKEVPVAVHRLQSASGRASAAEMSATCPSHDELVKGQSHPCRTWPGPALSALGVCSNHLPDL